MIVIARTSAPTISIHRRSRQIACNRYRQPLTIARSTAAFQLQRYSAPFATVRLPHFPAQLATLIDGGQFNSSYTSNLDGGLFGQTQTQTADAGGFS